MNEDNNKMIKELKKDLKPDLYLPIWSTIICSGPPLNLIFRYFIERDMKNPAVAIIISIIAIIWIILNWYWYVKERNDFNKDWEKISLELHTLELHNLDFDEKPSKDVAGKIFHVLMATGTASLIMSIVFAVTIMFANQLWLGYLLLFCIFIFFIAGAGLLIIGGIALFKFISLEIKCGRFKKE